MNEDLKPIFQPTEQPSEQANLGLAQTRELLDELQARNEGGQRPKFSNNMDQATAHIQKLRIAFMLRDGGLEYRTVD
jgi:hypothetical protein